MKQHNVKKSVRWERVAILLIALISIFYLLSGNTQEIEQAAETQPYYYLCKEVVVKNGDTIWSLLEAQRFTRSECLTAIEAIKEINCLDSSELWVGKKLLIPTQIIRK